MDDRDFFRIAKALADPSRFGIFQKIASATGEVACRALLDRFDMTPATMSHHIKELTGAGLIEGRREGQCMHLRARRAVIRGYAAELKRRISATS